MFIAGGFGGAAGEPPGADDVKALLPPSSFVWFFTVAIDLARISG
jgi:hypothetical protein